MYVMPIACVLHVLIGCGLLPATGAKEKSVLPDLVHPVHPTCTRANWSFRIELDAQRQNGQPTEAPPRYRCAMRAGTGCLAQPF